MINQYQQPQQGQQPRARVQPVQQPRQVYPGGGGQISNPFGGGQFPRPFPSQPFPGMGGGGGGQGQINGPGGIQGPNPGLPQPFPSAPFPGMSGGANVPISGPGGTMLPAYNPNLGLPKPFPSAPPPGFSYPGGMGQGQPQQYQQPSQINPGQGYRPQTGLQQRFGQQRGYPTSAATSNPYMQQFRQPPQQPQQMPANPYNPYQNDWNWNQSGPFPGNRFPAY